MPSVTMTLQQKVEKLSGQLGLSKGGSLIETVDQAVEEVGLGEEAKSMSLSQKVDACMAETMGNSGAPSGAPNGAPSGAPSGAPNGAPFSAPNGAPGQAPMALDSRRQAMYGPPNVGFGGSYESHMFGDYGGSGWGGMPVTRTGMPMGYGFGGPHGAGGWSGWGGYMRGGTWDIAYGGEGYFGDYSGFGGLRRGSAAERAISRRNANAADGNAGNVATPRTVAPAQTTVGPGSASERAVTFNARLAAGAAPGNLATDYMRRQSNAWTQSAAAWTRYVNSGDNAAAARDNSAAPRRPTPATDYTGLSASRSAAERRQARESRADAGGAADEQKSP